MRAVIYARYSSTMQRDASIEDQVRACRAWIEREGGTLTATYTDHALSGSDPHAAGLPEAAGGRAGRRFDVVVAEALDRLSRDQEDVAGLFKHLRYAGVKLVTLAEGEISELHVGLKGTMNALFLKDLAAKTHRGLHGRVEQGRSAAASATATRIRREHDARGETVHGGREIDEAEAAVVQRIFTAFANGRSPRDIAVELNRTASPVRRAGPGTPRPSTATGSAATASSTTNSMSGGWSGTGSASSRIPRRASARRG